MAKNLENIDLESQHNDKCPLLNDSTSSNKCKEILTSKSIISTASSSIVANDGISKNSISDSNVQNEAVFLGPCCNILTMEETPSRNCSSAPCLGREPSPNASTSSSRPWTFSSNQYDTRQGISPLNSGAWISIEFVATLGQVIASIAVLSSLDLDDLLSLLSIWIIGYATACLATLPLLYWRYKYKYIILRNQNLLVPPQTSPPTPIIAVGSNSYVSLTPSSQGGTRENEVDNVSNSHENRFHKVIGKFKIGLDCFFAIWFVVGNVWVFGPHSSSHEEPNLYSCIAYAMPFMLCTTICCCLPCIVAFLGLHEVQHQRRGVSLEFIATLPTYKFKAKFANNSNDINKEENEVDNQGGIVAEGRENERLVSNDDALCCICLGKYKDKVELKELPCSHHFHIDCVDKWLKINASCPLCKYDLISGTSG